MLEDVSDAELEPLPHDFFSDGEDDDINLADFAPLTEKGSIAGTESAHNADGIDFADFAHFAERSEIVVARSTLARTLVDSESGTVLHKRTAAAMLSGHAKQSSDRLTRVRQAKDNK